MAGNEDYTFEQKREAIARELAFRMRLYPRRVTDGSMSRTQADHEIAVMRAVLADYEALAAKERAAED